MSRSVNIPIRRPCLTTGKSAQADTPIRPLPDQPEKVTVIDPTHPLFRREFALVATTGSAVNGHAHVVYRGDALLKLPIRATSLSAASPRLPASKLSPAAIRDLIRLSLQAQANRPAIIESSAIEPVEDDVEPAPLSSHRGMEGEP
jgi:hypothetical protein